MESGCGKLTWIPNNNSTIHFSNIVAKIFFSLGSFLHE